MRRSTASRRSLTETAASSEPQRATSSRMTPADQRATSEEPAFELATTLISTGRPLGWRIMSVSAVGVSKISLERMGDAIIRPTMWPKTTSARSFDSETMEIRGISPGPSLERSARCDQWTASAAAERLFAVRMPETMANSAGLTGSGRRPPNARATAGSSARSSRGRPSATRAIARCRGLAVVRPKPRGLVRRPSKWTSDFASSCCLTAVSNDSRIASAFLLMGACAGDRDASAHPRSWRRPRCRC